MASCKYYDCGYCYAPKDIKSNDVKGACIEPEYCPYLKTQMTEKEKIEGEIKILQKKLALIEELEKTKSPVEEAFKRVYSVYPSSSEKSVFWTDDDEDAWIAFQNGYSAAQEDYKVGGYQEEQGTWNYDPDAKFRKQEEVKKLQEKDWSYKIADEHGELNPYKQYLNSVEDEKKMEELGFVKNSDGNWTARPLGETAQELVKKLQEKEWDIKVETDYLTGKARHKTKIVDKDGNDYKPEPLTTEELLKPQPEKRKIDDLAEKLLPDDHPYKIADEHGETTR